MAKQENNWICRLARSDSLKRGKNVKIYCFNVGVARHG